MPARESEAFVLRVYPFAEADLIVSFFTRDRGKLRGLAKGVRRPKSRFGAGLERMARSRIFYFQKQTVELARIDRAELAAEPLTMRADYAASLALDYIAEVAEEMLPEHEPHDAYFRLLALVTGRVAAELRRAPAANGAAPGWLWRTLTYFSLWSLRLGGWLPPLDVCLETGAAIGPEETAWYERGADGLLCAAARGPNSWPLTPESRAIARRMLRASLADLADEPWRRETAADLRRFLDQRLEAHFEKRLKTLGPLSGL